MKSQALHANVKIVYRKEKLKAMGNITATMDHYPRNELIGDNDPRSDMLRSAKY